LPVVRQSRKPLGLATVHRRVTLGAVAHQNLTESGLKRLDVAGEIVTVLKSRTRPDHFSEPGSK
jgi:hypothetical protein